MIVHHEGLTVVVVREIGIRTDVLSSCLCFRMGTPASDLVIFISRHAIVADSVVIKHVRSSWICRFSIKLAFEVGIWTQPGESRACQRREARASYSKLTRDRFVPMEP